MMVPCELKRWTLNKEILRMIAAAVFVFNFLVNLRLKQINLPANLYLYYI